MKKFILVLLASILFVGCSRSITLEVRASNNENYLHMYIIDNTGSMSIPNDSITFKDFVFDDEDFVIVNGGGKFTVYSNKRLMYTEE